MSNFLYDFVDIIKNCSYDNTYKMAWAKSLIELSIMKDYDEQDDEVVITLEEIAECFIKYYYNHTVFFNLIQGSNYDKPPIFISLAKSLITHYNDLVNKNQPVRFERAIKRLQSDSIYQKVLKQSVRILKLDVSYRFLNLRGTSLNHIYSYNKGDDALTIKTKNLIVLKNHAYMLLDVINYRWSLILETFNSSPRIAKKVKIIDETSIQRKSLNKYYKYIALDNPKKLCFVCDKPIEDGLEIDHVIPWSYMYSDDLWNLVFVHKQCNLTKTDNIPSEIVINKLENRNKNLIIQLEYNHIKNKDYNEMVFAKEENLVKKFWIGCQ